MVMPMQIREEMNDLKSTIGYHFICNCLQNNCILLNYILTTSQTTDILTKALPPTLHARNIALVKFTDTTLSSSLSLVQS